MTKEERKAYMKAYCQAHKEQRKASMKAWRAANKDYMKAWHAAHKEEHKASMKAWRAAHREEYNASMKAWRAAHREERKAYTKKYQTFDVNSLGQTKQSIRLKSISILNKSGIKIPGYQIHHCFTYDDASKFIYCSKETHLKIHQYLRDNNIDADSNHYEQIKHLLDENVVTFG